MFKNFIKKIANKILGKKLVKKVKALSKFETEDLIIKKRRDFYKQFLKPGDTYYDVGANYGNRIEPLLKYRIRIIAIEPQPECIKYLKKKYENRITIIPKGLGEKKGSKTMFLSNAHTISSFSKEWIKATQDSGRFSMYKWDRTQLMEMDTLNNLILDYGKPQFVKIDVEGYEYEVLRGLSQPIKTISFEYTTPERKKSVIDCINQITILSSPFNVVFNYSIGESMEWALNNWLPPKEMLKVAESPAFLKSRFGDIYAKTNINN